MPTTDRTINGMQRMCDRVTTTQEEVALESGTAKKAHTHISREQWLDLASV